MSGISWPATLGQLISGSDLTRDEAYEAMAEIMAGHASESQIAALLVALRAKGESAEEMTGLVDAMVDASVQVDVGEPVVDSVGTGGDQSGTFNISTCAALVASAAGIVVAKHGIPAAVAGFRPDTLLAAMYSVLRQRAEKRLFLDNCYPEVVRPGGNPVARGHLDEVMQVVDANWRGIGIIPRSGYRLREAYAAHDARLVYRSYADESRKRVGEMPPGCDCANVVLGKVYPNQCRLYGLACTPRKPVGPCMVSDEGACRIWWSAGYRDNEWEGRKKRQSVG